MFFRRIVQFLNYSREWFLKFLPSFFLVCTIFTITLVHLSVRLRLEHENNPLNDIWSTLRNSISNSFWLGFCVGILILWLLLAIHSKGYSEYFAPLKYGLNKWPLFYSIVFTCVLFIGIACLNRSIDGDHPSAWVSYFQKDPGGFFAIIVNVFTFYGLWLTLQGVWEIRRTINSFSDLIDRLCHMIDHASPSDPVWILAYTPAIGYLSQPADEWDKFCNSVTRQQDGGKCKVKIICLNENDLENWHNLFVNRRTLKGVITRIDTENATINSENLILNLTAHGTRISDDGFPIVHRLPWQFMPGHYLFITKNRAIVANPLFLPLPRVAQPVDQSGLPTVQMIGFETQEKFIISLLRQMYIYYLQLSDSPLCEVKNKITIGDLSQNLNIASQNIQDYLNNTINIDLVDDIGMASLSSYKYKEKIEQLKSKYNNDINMIPIELILSLYLEEQ